MSSNDIATMLLLLAVLLFSALLMGGLFRKLKLPAITGEILTGVILGPFLAPMIPKIGSVSTFLSGFNIIAVIFLLMLSGTEITFSNAIKHRKISLNVGTFGLLLPFSLGLLVVYFFPSLITSAPGISPLVTQLFFATAMSISALPVIAKTLMDLNLLKTDVGIVTMTSAMFNDLFGWVIFAGVLSMARSPSFDGSVSPMTLIKTIALTLLFTLLMLTLVRKIVDRILPHVNNWSGRVLAFCICFTLLSAAFTESIGVHALFGAFIAGIVIGDSKHFTLPSQKAVEEFVLSFFAPLFMATIGLRVDFIHNFDPLLTLTVILIACTGKILGCGLAAQFSGMPSRKAWAIGFAMNARGAMEIILGSVALHHGIIGEPLFVSLVIMAIVTSLMTGPALARLVKSSG